MLPREQSEGGFLTMEPTAIWIVYTLMFGYPVPTLDEHEFTNQSACVIYMHSFTQEVIDNQFVGISRDHDEGADPLARGRLFPILP